MSDEELTKMLRSSANRVVNYAGDRIEALTAELRVVKEDRDTYRAALVGAGFLPDRAALKGESHE